MKAWLLLTVAAVVVIVLVALAVRDDVADPPQYTPASPIEPSEPAPAVAAPTEVAPVAPAPAAPVETGPADGPEVLDERALMGLLMQFNRFEGEWREWARSRGYPSVDGSGVPLYEQPYDQYDDDTLRGLAGNGDMWAAQILAQRLASSSPAEAIELFRQAAARGSVYAMNQMAGLYNRIADKRREVEFKSDDQALEQVYAMRDSPVSPQVAGYAWTVVAEMAGSEPFFGNIASAQLERRLEPEQLEEACALAGGMYDELLAQRESLGMGDFDRNPPPLVYSSADNASRCGHEPSAGLNLGGCREKLIESGGQQITIWLCSDQAGS